MHFISMKKHSKLCKFGTKMFPFLFHKFKILTSVYFTMFRLEQSGLFVCAVVLRPSQPSGVMSSAVS